MTATPTRPDPAATPAAGVSVRHGTPAGYRDDRCKCDPCKAAIAKEHNLYQLRRSANGGRPLTVPKLGSVRRIQALMALGWPRRELARQAGYKGDAFALILNGERSSLTLATARRVSDLYDRLSMTIGPSAVTRSYARRAGWPPPLAWNDIDDPAEQPRRWRHTDRRTTAELADEWDFLRREGYTRRTAAERMGISKKRLEKAIERQARRMREAS